MPTAGQFRMLDRQVLTASRDAKLLTMGIQCSSIGSQKLIQYDIATTVQIDFMTIILLHQGFDTAKSQTKSIESYLKVSLKK